MDENNKLTTQAIIEDGTVEKEYIGSINMSNRGLVEFPERFGVRYYEDGNFNKFEHIYEGFKATAQWSVLKNEDNRFQDA